MMRNKTSVRDILDTYIKNLLDATQLLPMCGGKLVKVFIVTLLAKFWYLIGIISVAQKPTKTLKGSCESDETTIGRLRTFLR
jgi:hypothetical protein